MSAGNPHDPELHLLRSIARSLDGRASTEVESARFGVFAATESGDSDGARRWLASLRVALLAYAPEHLCGDGLAAVERIEARL